MSTFFVTKLGVARKVERSRIWLEGDRLKAAGFVVGSRFYVEREVGKHLRFVLGPAPTPSYRLRTVSGKGDKPIIDVTGYIVKSTFTGTHVSVQFDPGVIVVHQGAPQ